jgi:hypothetical protein
MENYIDNEVLIRGHAVELEPFSIVTTPVGGHVVTYLVEALCYKPEGHGF